MSGSFGSYASRGVLLSGSSALQTTCVGSNNSFGLRVTTSITRPWTVFMQVKAVDWTNGNANYQEPLTLVGGACMVYYDRTAGTFKTYTAGNTLYSAVNKYAGWAAIAIQCDASGNVSARFKPSGGSISTAAVNSSVNSLTDVQFLRNTVYSGEQPYNARACSGLILTGLIDNTEFTALAESPTPGSFAAASVWGQYPMTSVATAHLDTSGNGNHMTVTGTGVDVTDSPY